MWRAPEGRVVTTSSLAHMVCFVHVAVIIAMVR